MADVYQGAFFTLSAALNTGAHEGILRERATYVPHCRLHYRNFSGTHCDGLIGIGPHPRHPRQEPLGEHGWTYQKDILSRRVLKFGSTQLSWKCCHAEWTESTWKPAQARLEKGVILDDPDFLQKWYNGNGGMVES